MDPQAGQAHEHRGSLKSLVGSCALLAAVVVPVAATLGAIGYSRNGGIGVAAAALAGGVCCLSASLALVAVFVGQVSQNPIAGLLGSMILRMGLPLAAGLAIQKMHAPLAEAGCFPMILAVYLVVLVVETWLSLRLVRQATPRLSLNSVSGSDPSVAGGITGSIPGR